jgi:hypothetical protein
VKAGGKQIPEDSRPTLQGTYNRVDANQKSELELIPLNGKYN